MKIIKLDVVDSTNTYLKTLSKQSFCQDEMVVWAMKQTAGRGQQGASWQSEFYKNLTFSIYKRIENFSSQKYFSLNIVVSLAVYELLQEMKIESLSLKWPNDILVQQKKICGILIENVLNNQYITETIIGIGLNVNQVHFPNLPQVTSLKNISGNDFELEEILLKLSEKIVKKLSDFPMNFTQKDFEKYEKCLFRKGIPSVFEDDFGNRFMGIIQGVTQLGGLKVLLENDIEKVFSQKEIRLLY